MTDGPIFFTDRDLGREFPRRLAEAGLRVERHDDHFDPLTDDSEWLSVIGRRGWFALTHDQRIRYRSRERRAVIKAGVGLFVLIGKAPFRELADNFVRTAPRVSDFIRSHPRPFIAKIYRASAGELRPGRVELWLS